MKTGDWVWDQIIQQPAQIISMKKLWGQETIKVFYPGKNIVKTIEPKNLTQIKKTPVDSKQKLIHVLVLSKIINLLQSKDLLSPTQADIIPLPHQLFALSKALKSNRIRYLFADEVGLGKTIEAALVLTELKNQDLVKRILIVAPRGLTKQWVDELYTRFNEKFQLVIPSHTTELQESNIWLQTDQIITSLDSVKPIRSRAGWPIEKVELYNEKRYKDLVEANWDLIIIDEAHKIAGASTGVARHRLGKSLSENTPYLLLLSATPHQGRTEQFQRLMSLLEPEKFEHLENITKEQVLLHVIRTEKRLSINHEGAPLFTPRTTKLIPVKWDPRHNEQRRLYDEVTDYIRYGYNKAVKENRVYIGFLMILMQRLVSSSTRAIRQTLEKRLIVLETGEAIYTEEEDPNLLSDLEGQIKIDELFLKIGDSLRDEKKEVENLASLARRCEKKGPDARAEELLKLILNQRSEENNPDLKFLIFTEFLPTQEMLKEFLENIGFKIEIINGSIDLNARLEAQSKFEEEAEILISTEAGGEGINLQFCHIVINYDLPWNPMRLEQRIGRVDRIGQKHPVKAFNLVFENTVEYRIREVLEDKLHVILHEFGVDKLGDVLDTDEAEINFTNIYKKAVISPEKATQEAESYLEKIKQTLRQRQENQLIKDEKQLDISESQKILNHPLPKLTEKIIMNYLQMQSGTIEKQKEVYNLVFPDGTRYEKVKFDQKSSLNGKLITNKLPQIKKILNDTSIYIPGMEIPIIKTSNIPPALSGYFSLWEVKVESKFTKCKNIFPVFINEKKRFLKPSSNQLWEILIQDDTLIEISEYDNSDPIQIFNVILDIAKIEGEIKLDQLEKSHKDKTLKIKRKGETKYWLKNQLITQLRSVKERMIAQKSIEKEYQEWSNAFESDAQTHYELLPITLIRVESLNV